MMLQWLMLLTLFVHNSLAFGLYDDIDDYDLRRRQLGGPPGVQPTSKTKSCHKDVLVVLDSSGSIGVKYFKHIQKFLIKLIEKLNVRKDGTQLGFITFSSAANTKKLLDVGEKTDPNELTNWLESLDYTRDLTGGFTRTGLGFKIANEMFSQASPLNARDTVQDVILLFTDGEPRSPKGSAVEKAMVVTETNKLKQKNVTIVGVAAGSPKVIKTFKKDIQSWVTDSSEVAETSLETLDKDVDKLVNKIFNPLCKPRPGQCFCKGDSGGTFTAYMKKGEITTQVDWVIPITCTGGASYTVDPPNVNSGDRFGPGKHVITYSSSYINHAGNNVDLKCPLQFKVVTCECPSIQIVRPTGSPGVDGKYYVSWTEPEPNCPAQPSPSNPSKPSGRFAAGKSIVTYKYRVANKFNLKCHVKIVVPAGKCFCKGDSGGKFTVYMKKGEITTPVDWVIPITCTGGASYTVDPPNVKPGDKFGLGKHVITYSSSHTNNYAGKKGYLKCRVKFTVAICECPSIQTVRAKNLPGADKKSYVSWTEPKPNCPAQPSPSNPSKPSGRFSAGESTVTYKYRVENKFYLKCHVKIVVPGEFCDDTAYDLATHVCCCGKISKKDSKHRCCGQIYINPSKKMCCQGNKPVRLPGPCP